MENEQSWEAPRDALLEQLSGLIGELESHEEGRSTTIDLLDRLDGTRRAIDRLAATISDKFANGSSVDFFSPAVTRPLSTATNASNSSSEKSYLSDSHLTHLSSPTTLISEYEDDLHHRRRLLDEDEDILRHLQNIDEEESDDVGSGDQDERLERLSLLLSSVLKEANEAIRDYETIQEEPEAEAEVEVGERTTRCSSRLSIGTSTLTSSMDFTSTDRPLKPMYSHPALQSQETIRPMLQPPTAPPTPPPTADNSGLLPSPDELSISSLTSSMETVKPAQPKQAEEKEDLELVVDTEVAAEEAQKTVSLVDELLADSPRELSLDYLLGDYLNEVIMDVRRNEFIGARFWIFLIVVMMMWSWMFVTNWATTSFTNLACGCRTAA
ncbi:hypothetical protein ABW19_dt0200908 [Dactylella cylindrospora]|nr:hypothetical protein ABW19_dt0200908 [Dactylella cylindrospora]